MWRSVILRAFALLPHSCACLLALLPLALSAESAPASALAPSLPLRLVGIVIRDGGEAMATIEDPASGRQTFYQAGDTVGDARLVRVLADRVVLDVAGTEVELRLAGVPAGAGPAAVRAPPPPEGRGEAIRRARQLARGETSPPSRASWDHRLSMTREEVAALGRRADLTEHLTPEGSEGLRVGDIPPDSLLARLGLRPGDVVRAVDRRPVGASLSLPEALTAAAATTRAGVVVEFERDGRRSVRTIPFRQ